MKRLGRRDPGPFPLLPRCPECKHFIPANPERPDLIAHWPWCSKATPEQMQLWRRRKELRALRTIGRCW